MVIVKVNLGELVALFILKVDWCTIFVIYALPNSNQGNCWQDLVIFSCTD